MGRGNRNWEEALDADRIFCGHNVENAGKLRCEQHPTERSLKWSVIRTRTWKDAVAHTNPVPEKVFAANALPTTWRCGSFPAVVFQKKRKPHTTALLTILLIWSKQEHYKLKTDDIEKLFLSVLEDSGQDTDDARRVFSTLVRSTLEFRDHILATRDVVVTVEDVRSSLEWLIPALAEDRMPETENEIRLGLLIAWLKELKPI